MRLVRKARGLWRYGVGAHALPPHGGSLPTGPSVASPEISASNSFASWSGNTIEDADSFFGAPAACQVHRSSTLTHCAVASLKRYLPEPRYRDLSRSRELSRERGVADDAHGVTARVRYEAACRLCWQWRQWGASGRKKATIWYGKGRSAWVPLPWRSYCGWGYGAGNAAVLPALGLGELDRAELRGACLCREPSQRRQRTSAGGECPSSVLRDRRKGDGTSGGYGGTYVRLSDWIHHTLRPHVERIIPSDDSYSLVFDKLEILMALGYERHRRDDWDRPPVGAFIHRSSNRKHIMGEIKESLSKMQNESAFVTSDLFGDTEDDCQKNIAALEDAVRSYIGQVGVR